MSRIRKSMSRDILGHNVSGPSTLHDEVNVNQNNNVTRTHRSEQRGEALQVMSSTCESSILILSARSELPAGGRALKETETLCKQVPFQMSFHLET